MSINSPTRALVTGATGMQGGAVAQALLRTGHHVSAFVRHPESEASRALAEQGIALAVGDLEDLTSLEAASQGHDVVFSVQLPGVDPADPGAEERQARNIVTAAKKAGITQIVHTSVSAVGWREQHPEVTDIDPLMNTYWDQKEAAEEVIRTSGLEHWTIFRPALYMEDFRPPKLAWQFPELPDGKLVIAASLDTPMALICAEDLGAGVAAAVADPDRFHQAEIELAGDVRTFAEIADTITTASVRTVEAVHVSLEDRAERLGAPSAFGHWWDEAVGYPARPEHAERYGLQLTTLQEWAAHQDWTFIAS